MKPVGGKYVEKLTSALSQSNVHSSSNTMKRHLSLLMIDTNAPLQSKLVGSTNPMA